MATTRKVRVKRKSKAASNPCKISKNSSMAGRGTRVGISSAAKYLATKSKEEKRKRVSNGCKQSKGGLSGVCPCTKPKRKRKSSTAGTSVVTKISRKAKQIRKRGERWTTAISRASKTLRREGRI